MTEAWRFPFGAESSKGFVGMFGTFEEAFKRNYITVNATGSIGEDCEYTSIVTCLTALEAGTLPEGTAIFIKSGTYTFSADLTITKSCTITSEEGVIFTSSSGTKKLSFNNAAKVMDIEGVYFDTFELEYNAFLSSSLNRCVFADSSILDVINSGGGGILTVRNSWFSNSYITYSNYTNVLSFSGTLFINYSGSVFQASGTSPIVSISGSVFAECGYTSSGNNNISISQSKIYNTTARARHINLCYIYHNNTTKYGWESSGGGTLNEVSQSSIYMINASALPAIYCASSGTHTFSGVYIYSTATTSAYAIDLSSTSQIYMSDMMVISTNGGIYDHGENYFTLSSSYIYATTLRCLYTTEVGYFNIQGSRFLGNDDYYPVELVTTGASVGTIQFSGNTIGSQEASYTKSYVIYCDNSTKAGSVMITNNIFEAIDGAEAGVFINNFNQGLIMGNSIPGTTTATNIATLINEHNL